MGVGKYAIDSAALATGRKQDYELSILAGVDSFAYILRDRVHNRLLALHAREIEAVSPAERSERLHALIADDDNLRQAASYGKIALGWESDRMTLVPPPLFDAGRASEYLEALTTVGLEDTVRHEPTGDATSQLVYAVPADALSVLMASFADAPLSHYARGLLTAWSGRSRRQGHDAISCSVRGRRLFLAGHRGGQLRFANHFEFSTSQDAVYFVLLAFEQSGFDAARHPLYLCGEIVTTGELYNQLYRYVADVRFCQYPTPPEAGTEFAGLPAHLYFDLLCLG